MTSRANSDPYNASQHMCKTQATLFGCLNKLLYNKASRHRGATTNCSTVSLRRRRARVRATTHCSPASLRRRRARATSPRRGPSITSQGTIHRIPIHMAGQIGDLGVDLLRTIRPTAAPRPASGGGERERETRPTGSVTGPRRGPTVTSKPSRSRPGL